MFNSEKFMNSVKSITDAYDVNFNDVLKSWGVENSLAQVDKFFHANEEYFLKIWVKMLHSNVESAVWCTVYNAAILVAAPKKAMQMADDAAKAYRKVNYD